MSIQRTTLSIWFLVFLDKWISCQGFSRSTPAGFSDRVSRISLSSRCYSSSSSPIIDYQSDTSNYGRGEMHLSAVLNEGDVVVYQTGTWYVDGVEVGGGGDTDDCEPSIEYAVVETLQVVWTHNCEHGVIRGMELELKDGEKFVNTGMDIEFGPEQLLARIPVKWVNRDDDSNNAMIQRDAECIPLVEISNDMWELQTGE